MTVRVWCRTLRGDADREHVAGAEHRRGFSAHRQRGARDVLTDALAGTLALADSSGSALTS
jgi:hypothetical protein